MTPYPAFDGSQSCAGLPTEDFFADHAGNAQEKIAAAKAVCGGCPWLARCYDYALTHDVHGVWAGTTAYERAAIRKATGVVAAPISVDFGLRNTFTHGTAAGYRRHLRLYEKPCENCRAAESLRCAKYREGRAS